MRKGLADIVLHHDYCTTGVHVITCTLCLKTTLQPQMLSLYKLWCVYTYILRIAIVQEMLISKK